MLCFSLFPVKACYVLTLSWFSAVTQVPANQTAVTLGSRDECSLPLPCLANLAALGTSRTFPHQRCQTEVTWSRSWKLRDFRLLSKLLLCVCEWMDCATMGVPARGDLVGVEALSLVWGLETEVLWSGLHSKRFYLLGHLTRPRNWDFHQLKWSNMQQSFEVCCCWCGVGRLSTMQHLCWVEGGTWSRTWELIITLHHCSSGFDFWNLLLSNNVYFNKGLLVF